MARVYPLISSFNGGEWDPVLWGRSDNAKYAVSCRELSNFLPLVQGPATKRPGLRYLGDTRDRAGELLVPFVFSTVQAYQIEAGSGYFRFWKDRGQIQDPDTGSPIEVSTVYSPADLKDLSWVQSADVLYLWHPRFRPYKLSRTSHVDWSVTPIVFKDGPYLREDPDNQVTITASDVLLGVTITLAASAPLFEPGHVGALWRLNEPSGSLPYGTWQPDTEVNSGDRRKYAGRVYLSHTTARTDTTPPTHDEPGMIVSDGHVDWEYLHDGTGTVQITAVTDRTHATATVQRRLVGVEPTRRWREGAWSDFRGWPRCGAFHQDRLYAAGTTYQPQTVWASAVSDYQNHTPSGPDGEVADDQALAVTLNDEQVNAILWMSSGPGGLAIGTTGGLFPLRASNPDDPVTPSNVGVAAQIKVASTSIRPVRTEDKMLFVLRDRRIVAEFIYQGDLYAYGVRDLTLFGGHLTRPRIRAMVYQKDPWSTLWCVRDDGVLVGQTYLPSQQVEGWHRHPIDGKVISASVIPGPDQDELWLIVERTIGGQSRRYVELLEAPFRPVDAQDKAGAFYVDCGSSYVGAPATVISNIDWLEGRTVRILADGASHPDRQVKGGSITLAWAAKTVQLGLPIMSRLETMDVDAGAEGGTSIARRKRIDNVAALFHETLGGRIGRNDEFEDLLYRTAVDPMDLSPPLFTGSIDVPFAGSWDDAATVAFEHDEAFPATVVAFGPRLTTNER